MGTCIRCETVRGRKCVPAPWETAGRWLDLSLLSIPATIALSGGVLLACLLSLWRFTHEQVVTRQILFLVAGCCCPSCQQEGVGKHNGAYQGNQLFTCPPVAHGGWVHLAGQLATQGRPRKLCKGGSVADNGQSAKAMLCCLKISHPESQSAERWRRSSSAFPSSSQTANRQQLCKAPRLFSQARHCREVLRCSTS